MTSLKPNLILRSYVFPCSLLLATALVSGVTACSQRLYTNGDAYTQNQIGNSYIGKDDAQAAVWYRKSAEQGYVYAQYSLGEMYAHGKGMQQDYAQAADWFRKAAEQGLPMAQYNLGVMYLNGEGVQQDYQQAYAWSSVAATKDYGADAVTNRDLCATKLTPAMLAVAQALASQYYEQYKITK